jgi:hypothetical protein
MKQPDKEVHLSSNKRKWTIVSFVVVISWLLTWWGVYGIGEYGIALFVLTPIFIGTGSTIMYGYNQQITKRQAFLVSYVSLGIFGLGLLVFGIEGLICMAMAAPIALFLTWVGSVCGYIIVKDNFGNAIPTVLGFIFLIPTFAFIEKDMNPDLTSVVTSIEIDAPAGTVWRNVIEFPQLTEPTEFIFKTGIAYPVNARIEGSGVGAIRHCNFTTGSFVEPITVWDQPNLLKFDVMEQPAPMKEISFWDINAPHLHDYFISRQGQFKLISLPNGRTLLEGTTWYYHDIKPAFYWRIWSDYIIHKIHQRVLVHIKSNAESKR